MQIFTQFVTNSVVADSYLVMSQEFTEVVDVYKKNIVDIKINSTIVILTSSP